MCNKKTGYLFPTPQRFSNRSSVRRTIPLNKMGEGIREGEGGQNMGFGRGGIPIFLCVFFCQLLISFFFLLFQLLFVFVGVDNKTKAAQNSAKRRNATQDRQ